jgi:hypothetical protein
VRSAGVIAHPVLVGVISGIEPKVRPVILAQSSCRRAKGSGLSSSALGSIGTKSRRSSCFFPERVDPRGAPPEFVVGARPEEEVLFVFALRKSAPEFFRVFATSAKLTDFEAEDDGPPESWLWTRRGLESAYREVVRKLTTLLHMSCAKLRSSGFLWEDTN